ncbi:MarR family winged helix-turn-helix transcriptional regulator [Streptomyces omiyaensis]|uniref:MarR family winged helix-turn-helix transcriptional regulator n=1 Tax=Streptomyces omiyaensis TaxID=68247 RepID=A0ABW7C0X3_9ACTN|nr:MarR family transcriptional regulator [Streptomyces omiyaensis]GGY84257.1 transcriptional regulator [Streptomyces omiyaensis]
MQKHAGAEPAPDDIEAVTRAVLTASRLLVAVSARSLATVEESITLPQFRMLVVLSTHGPSKLVTLAEHLGVQPSTAMRMVDRMIAAGLVSRRTNPGNRRETMQSLTSEGERVVQHVTTRRRDEITGILRRLDPAQRSALVNALAAFNSAGQEPPYRAGDADPLPLGWSDPTDETR